MVARGRFRAPRQDDGRRRRGASDGAAEQETGGRQEAVKAMVPAEARIVVAGQAGLVGSAVTRALAARGYGRLLTARRDQLDLRDQAAVNYWFKANRPEYIYLVAGTVGGILANSTRPAEFIYDNMMIHATVVHAAHVFGVEKLLYLGSSCIYPRECRQPMTEDQLL